MNELLKQSACVILDPEMILHPSDLENAILQSYLHTKLSLPVITVFGLVYDLLH